MGLLSTILKYVEYALGKLLISRRGYDDGLFSRTPAFRKCPEPTIQLSSLDCGPSYSRLSHDYSMFGKGLMPTLTWPEANENIREYLVIIEDVDAPFGGKPNVHGIYALIPPSTTSLSPHDLETVDTDVKGQHRLKSGFRVGKNRRNVVYIPCRPPLGHGPHRYFCELVALSEKLDPDTLSPVPTKEELAELVKGKVVAWGEWVGVYESDWNER
ncbi:hypothetical protein BP5796_13039 [Coleophoma crateriformis]|uniref:PEBP-like protein n=1 Tax=Coleophoma crateriformis TaxID=565419 RepID=A0A3D8Q589_9HELO|nr:hypothetical protein BP5796_13039 [Coleophoma crateriformis]